MTAALAASPTPAPAGPDATPAGAVDIPFPGGFVRYVTPNDITRWRTQTFFEKEPDTLAWIASFAPEDVMVDIGANVGMYTVWAAKFRGVRVYAFEPESQNYGLLNMNLYLNNLSEQVTAYCLALSNVAGFDSFYLGRFEPGGSCHAFGAPLDPNLQAMEPKFRQGCFAAPLDELVEAGVIPAPTHIKIDVDGLEHAIVEGMDKTLDRPELKSVLVEINGDLPAHQAILEHMAARGFHVDDRQRAASLQTEGESAGGGNVIFWKDAQAAARLGAVLAGEVAAPAIAVGAQPNLAGMSAEAAVDHAIAAIAATPVQSEPTPYWCCTEVFPQPFYEELLARMPAASLLTPAAELGWSDGVDAATENRSVLPFSEHDLSRLPEELAAFWVDLSANLRSERFALAMLRKFLPQIGERFGPNVGNVTFSASASLISDHGGYALAPHTDRPARVLATYFYLAEDDARPEIGTSLYLPKQPGRECLGGPHYGFEDFVNVATMPFLPNHAFCFFKTAKSFHGVEPLAEDAAPRNLVSYILETG